MADDPFDPRLTPARREIAARHLQGKVEALRYSDGESCEIIVPLAPVTATPLTSASLLTQALKGERATIYDRPGNGWAWGQLNDDGYVGWIPESMLRWAGDPPNRQITALRTFAFAQASIKQPPVATLPLGARLVVEHEDGGFAVTRDGWFIPTQHVGTLETVESDFVSVAEWFVGTPYLWGGKSSLGIDCSGLVQVALGTCGNACLRDSDMQQKTLGEALPLSQIDALQRGDLVFWKGHVAIARDADTMVHANAFHMSTAIEPTREAVARIATAGGGVTGIKRML